LKMSVAPNTTLARAFYLIVHVLKPGIRGQVCASTLQYNTSQVFNGNFTNKIFNVSHLDSSY